MASPGTRENSSSGRAAGSAVLLPIGYDRPCRREPSSERHQSRTPQERSLQMPSKEEVRLAKERVIPVLDAWMAAFNALDLEAWKATMQYPHYRLASGRMHIWEDADMDDAYMERVRTGLGKIGWHHSVWTRREIVHCSDQKIHVDTQFTGIGQMDRSLRPTTPSTSSPGKTTNGGSNCGPATPDNQRGGSSPGAVHSRDTSSGGWRCRWSPSWWPASWCSCCSA